MSESNITYAVERNVAVLTLNRPEKLNALTLGMWQDIMACMDEVDADPEVRALIITGEGRGFCAGADLVSDKVFDVHAKSRKPQPAPRFVDTEDPLRDKGGRMSLRFYSSLKPIIAAINGPAVGIGATMLLPMDYRIASENARFGFVFTQRGIVPEAASGWFLPRLVGVAQALDWTLTGRVFSAEEALKGGLVSAVHAPEDLLPAAHAIARQIADNAAPVSVSLARHLMWQGLTLDHPMEAHRIDSRLMASRGVAEDVKEGIGAFLAKRPAEFPNRVPADLPPFAPWREPPVFK